MAMPPPPQSALRTDEFAYADHGTPLSSPSTSPPSHQSSPQMQFPQPQFMSPEPSRELNNASGTTIGVGTTYEQSTGPYGGNTGGSSTGYSPNTNADDSFAFKSPDPFYYKVTKYINTRYQLLLDASTPHWAARWIFSLVILMIFMIRIVVAQGCPKIDPAFAAGGEFDIDDSNDSSGPMLPTRANDEFKPFIRRLPEFQFWLSATTATLISLFLTLFEIFDLPVFWPILLLYFILLFISTMRQQIRHMFKYGYVPWDKGKKKYGQSNQEPSSLFSTTI